MSEIIFSELSDMPNFDITNKSKSAAKMNITVWQNPDKVSVSVGMYWTGLKYGRGSRYWRWNTDKAFGFYRTSTGRPQPFSCRRPELGRSKGWVNVVPSKAFNLLGEDSPIGDAFTNAMWENFGITSFDDYYPMASQFGINKITGMPVNIRSAYRADKLEDFTFNIFGQKRGKVMLDCIEDVDPIVLAYASEFRGFADDDVIKRRLRSDIDEAYESNVSNGLMCSAPAFNLRKALAAVSKATANELCENGLTDDNFYDISRVTNASQVKQLRTDLIKSDHLYPDWHGIAR